MGLSFKSLKSKWSAVERKVKKSLRPLLKNILDLLGSLDESVSKYSKEDLLEFIDTAEEMVRAIKAKVDE